MKKKVVKVLVALVLGITAFFAVKTLTKPEVTLGNKSVEIIVLDLEKNTIFDQTIQTDAGLLGELIDEINENGSLKFSIDDNAYGRMIMGINDIVSDPVNGPWWMIYSETNPDALAQGYCNGMDTQTIYDSDIFTLAFESYE